MRVDEKLLAQAANAKLVHLNEQIIFPLLTVRIDQVLASICHELKHEGKVDSLKVAQIAAMKDLMQELETVARRGDLAAGKLNK